MTSRVCSIAVCLRMKCTILPWVREPRLSMQVLEARLWHLFFTRLTYNYADRYLGTYTYRYDGSSNFGPENRWAGFHSLATSWRFSNENVL